MEVASHRKWKLQLIGIERCKFKKNLAYHCRRNLNLIDFGCEEEEYCILLKVELSFFFMMEVVFTRKSKLQFSKDDRVIP